MENKKKPNLQALEKFVEENKHLLTLRQMRDIIRREKENGAHIFIHRIGRRIFIDVDKFFEWTKRKV
jgi:hypothetical protein